MNMLEIIWIYMAIGNVCMKQQEREREKPVLLEKLLLYEFWSCWNDC